MLVSVRTNTIVYAALLALIGVTVGAAYVDLGIFNRIAALGIACVKALLVLLVFMHVWWSSRGLKMSMIVMVVWLAVLAAITFSDYLTRTSYW